MEESPVNYSVSKSSETGGEDEELEGKVERKERNKERRRRNLENKKVNIRKTATKTSLMLGIDPIEDNNIEEHLKRTQDTRKARGLAVRDFLIYFLQLNE